MRNPRFLAGCVAAAAALQWQVGAQQPVPQYRIQPLTDLTGAPALSLAMRKLTTIGTVVHMTAHPDDENNAALALYARHVGARVALVTATRGDGGQNEIGTELFDALGILRTEELLTAHRYDGAEQYFTRAVDFGYSFSPEETLEKWGRQEILGDFVRHIRLLRPDVIVTMSPGGDRRGTAPSDVGGPRDRRVSRRRRSGAVPRADSRRPASVAGAQALSPGRRTWRPRRARWAPRCRSRAWPRAARRRATAPGSTGRHVRNSRHQHLRAPARLHDWRSGRRRLGHAHVPGPRADGCPAQCDVVVTYRLFETMIPKAQTVGGDVALRRDRRVARRAGALRG